MARCRPCLSGCRVDLPHLAGGCRHRSRLARARHRRPAHHAHDDRTMITTILAMRYRLGTAMTIALVALVGCSRGDGKDAVAGAEPAGGAVTLWTDSTELFMEHPALIVGAPDKFAVHLTDITDFAPLRSGRITLRFVPRDNAGEPLEVTQDAPRSPGIYGPAPEFKRPGIYDLTILVESPQARDSITVPALRVYGRAEEAPREEGGDAGGIAFLKEQQWKTEGFRTAFAMEGSVAASFEASGTVVPAAGRYAE